jgi:hypothetical protein
MAAGWRVNCVFRLKPLPVGGGFFCSKIAIIHMAQDEKSILKNHK